MSALGRMLRSRRLAVWMLAAVGVWSAIATSVPQESVDSDAVALFAAEHPVLEPVLGILGLHSAFSAPIFIGLLVLLGSSTILCAIERTGRAVRIAREAGKVRTRDVARLEAGPHLRLPLPAAVEPEAILDAAASALASLRLRARSGPSIAEGRAGTWGLMGSPVFHWALAGLILTIAIGQLTRSEGLMGVPVGETVADVPESYRVLDEGPLFPGHSGMGILVEEMELSLMDGDVDRGAAPTVVLLSPDGSEMARQLVYPNNPLQHGITTIHISDYGLSPEIVALGADGSEVGRLRVLLDFRDGQATRTTTSTVELLAGDGQATLALEISAALDTDVPTIEVVPASGGAPFASGMLSLGESLQVDGGAIEFSDTGYYARLSVVHDWSVGFIYALLGIGLAGISIAVLDPYRRVLVKVTGEGEDMALAVLIRHGRRSALFEGAVERALLDAVCEASTACAPDKLEA